MSLLNPLHIALQGLFPLTPIAVAIQGLLEELKLEQAQQVYGSGKGSRATTQAKRQDALQDDSLIDKVREKWDAIEKARERDKPKPKLETKPQDAPIKPVAIDPGTARPEIAMPEIAMPGALQAQKFVPVPIVTAPLLSSVLAVPPQDVLQNDDDDAMLLIMELL